MLHSNSKLVKGYERFLCTHSLSYQSLTPSIQELYLVITLGNSEKHIFHSDEDGVIQQWAEVLQPNNTLASPITPTTTTGPTIAMPGKVSLTVTFKST